jgi:hypothetical protein
VALNLIADRVKQVLMHRVRGMTEEERRTSLTEKVSEEVKAFAELRLTQRDVVEWSVAPQATIVDFLGGLDGPARDRLMTIVDLSDPIVAELEVPVTVGANWAGNPKVTRVSVEVTYPAAQHEDDKVKTLSFGPGDAEQVLRWRRARREKGVVNYRAIAFLEGLADPIPVGAGSSNGPVHVEVPAVGRFDLKARPNLGDFSLRGAGKISGVQLDYRYKAEGDPDHRAGSIVLRPQDAEAGRPIGHTTFRAIDAPVVVRPKYLRDGSPAIVGEEIFVWARPGEEAQLDVPSPWQDHLQVSARVRPGIPALQKVTVELQHRDDSSGFESTALIDLDADSDWQGATTLVQADAGAGRFRYRYTVLGADQLAKSPWLEAEGDGELPILPVLPVRARLARLELGTTYSDAILRLAYRDPAHRLELRHEAFVLAGDPDPVWLVPRADPNLDAFRWSMTLTPMTGGDVVEVPESEGRGENLVLRPPH